MQNSDLDSIETVINIKSENTREKKSIVLRLFNIFFSQSISCGLTSKKTIIDVVFAMVMIRCTEIMDIKILSSSTIMMFVFVFSPIWFSWYSTILHVNEFGNSNLFETIYLTFKTGLAFSFGWIVPYAFVSVSYSWKIFVILLLIFRVSEVLFLLLKLKLNKDKSRTKKILDEGILLVLSCFTWTGIVFIAPDELRNYLWALALVVDAILFSISLKSRTNGSRNFYTDFLQHCDRISKILLGFLLYNIYETRTGITVGKYVLAFNYYTFFEGVSMLVIVLMLERLTNSSIEKQETKNSEFDHFLKLSEVFMKLPLHLSISLIGFVLKLWSSKIYYLLRYPDSFIQSVNSTLLLNKVSVVLKLPIQDSSATSLIYLAPQITIISTNNLFVCLIFIIFVLSTIQPKYNLYKLVSRFLSVSLFVCVLFIKISDEWKLIVFGIFSFVSILIEDVFKLFNNC